MFWIMWTEPNGVSFAGQRQGYTAEQLTWVLNHYSFRGYMVTVTTDAELGRRAHDNLMGQYDSLGRLK